MATPKWRHEPPAECRALFEACQHRALKFDEVFTPWEVRHREVLRDIDRNELGNSLWSFKSEFQTLLAWEDGGRVENDDHLREFHVFLYAHTEHAQNLIKQLSARQRQTKRDGQPLETWLEELLQPLVNYQFEMFALWREIDIRLAFVLSSAAANVETLRQQEAEKETFHKTAKDMASDLNLNLPALRHRLRVAEAAKLLKRGVGGHWHWRERTKYEKDKEILKNEK